MPGTLHANHAHKGRIAGSGVPRKINCLWEEAKAASDQKRPPPPRPTAPLTSVRVTSARACTRQARSDQIWLRQGRAKGIKPRPLVKSCGTANVRGGTAKITQDNKQQNSGGFGGVRKRKRKRTKKTHKKELKHQWVPRGWPQDHPPATQPGTRKASSRTTQASEPARFLQPIHRSGHHRAQKADENGWEIKKNFSRFFLYFFRSAFAPPFACLSFIPRTTTTENSSQTTKWAAIT